MTLLLLGCNYLVDLGDTGVSTGVRGVLALGATELDLGTVAVGSNTSELVVVRNDGGAVMELGLDFVMGEADFCAYWEPTTAGCGDFTAERARPKDSGWIHTGRTWGDTARPDTGTASNARCEDAVDAPTTVLLEPGCDVAAVVVWEPSDDMPVLEALRVTARTNPTDRAKGRNTREPRNYVQEVHLSGEALAAPSFELAWSRGRTDWEWHWPDGSAETAELELVNPGTGDLTLGAVDASRCADVTVTAEPGAGTVLAAGDRAGVTLSYTATTSSALACAVYAQSTEAPQVYTVLRTVRSTANTAPSLSIPSPAPGDLRLSGEAFVVSVELADAEQPPSSMEVRLESHDGQVLGLSYPLDDSGQLTLLVPAGMLAAGPATLIATTGDVHGGRAKATVPIRVDTLAATDADGDGWDESEGDCNDSSAGTYPSAVELPDGEDNDCGGSIDEDTTRSDDDGDGFSEEAGDPDDGDDSTYPAAPESWDAVDNNGDGVVDDGTGFYDDDGDGLSELEGDCDDSDRAVRPGTETACADGIDDDCDGNRDAADRDCPGEPSAYMTAAPDACLPGERVTLELRHLPSDLYVDWATDGSSRGLQGSGSTASYTCDDVYVPTDRTVYATITNDSGQMLWAFTSVRMHPAGAVLGPEWTLGEEVEVTTPCAPTGGVEVAGVLGMLLLAVGARRRAPPRFYG